MKSLATFSLTTALAVLAGVSNAQVTYNETTGVFSCPIPNGAYCASTSLGGPIIIRCTNGVGQPGNCDDNLAGEFPQGVNYSPCWETSDKSGDAACSKNCIVYGGSGNFNGTFTLPNCTPLATPSSSSPIVSPTSSLSAPTSSLSAPTPTLSGSTTITSTGTSTFISGTVTKVETFTTTYCPTDTSTPLLPTPPTSIPSPPTIPVFTPTFTLIPTGSLSPSGTAVGTGGSGNGNGGGASGVNGTATGGSGSGNGGSGGHGGSATATPVGPSSTVTGTGAPEYTGAAVFVRGSSAGVMALFGGLVAVLFF